MALSDAIDAIQGILFIPSGMFLLLFGAVTPTISSTAMAFLASGWDKLLVSIKLIEPLTVFDTFGVLVAFVTTTIVLAAASIKMRKLGNVMKGMVLFTLLADPVMKIISNYLFFDLAGCTEIGQPTFTFPEGMPTGGCSSDDPNFIFVMFLEKGVVWLNCMIGGAIATRCESYVVPVSCIVAGADLLADGLARTVLLVESLLNIDQESTKIAIIKCRLASVYILAIICWNFQRGLKHHANAIHHGKSPEEAPGATGCAGYIMCRWSYLVLDRFMAWDMKLLKKVSKRNRSTRSNLSRAWPEHMKEEAERRHAEAEERAAALKKELEEAIHDLEEAEAEEREADTMIAEMQRFGHASSIMKFGSSIVNLAPSILTGNSSSSSSPQPEVCGMSPGSSIRKIELSTPQPESDVRTVELSTSSSPQPELSGISISNLETSTPQPGIDVRTVDL